MSEIIFTAEMPNPIPISQIYIGNGDLTTHLHPSPWLNPYVPVSSSEDEARSKFLVYAESRADIFAWLSPLFGKVAIVEAGMAGAHAAVIMELVEGLVENEQRKPKIRKTPCPKTPRAQTILCTTTTVMMTGTSTSPTPSQIPTGPSLMTDTDFLTYPEMLCANAKL